MFTTAIFDPSGNGFGGCADWAGAGD